MPDMPRSIRGAIRTAFTIALVHLRDTYTVQGMMSERDQHRAWIFFLLLSRMLLRPTRNKGQDGQRDFTKRIARFHEGDWVGLIQKAQQCQTAGTAN